MKTLLTLLVTALVLTFSACKKEQPVTNYPSPLEGQWNWVKSFNFLDISTPQTTGKNWELAFMQNLSFVQTGTLYPNNSGVYELTNDSVYLKFSGDSTKYRDSCKITNEPLMLDSRIFFYAPITFFFRKENYPPQFCLCV